MLYCCISTNGVLESRRASKSNVSMTSQSEAASRLEESPAHEPIAFTDDNDRDLADYVGFVQQVMRSLPGPITGACGNSAQLKDINVWSLCTGTAAELRLLRKMGCRFNCPVGADPLPASHTFVMQNEPPEHLYGILAEVLKGLKGEKRPPCIRHGKACTHKISDHARPHIIMAGVPCQPTSTQRNTRGTHSYRDHPLNAMKNEYIDIIAAVKPDTFVMEISGGFANKAKYTDSETPADEFCTYMDEQIQATATVS